MATSLSRSFVFLAALVLFGHVSFAQEEDDMDGDGDGDMGDMDGDGEGYDGDGDDGDGMDGDGDGGRPPPGELKELKTVDDFETFINDTDASVIGAFTAEKTLDPKAVRPADWDDEEDGEWEAPTIDNPVFENYKSISSSEYGYRYAYTTAPAVLERLKSKADSLYLYRSPYYVSKEHGDRARERFPGNDRHWTASAVSHWLETKAQPLVGEYSTATAERYKSPTLLIFMNTDWEQNSKSIKYVLKRARKVAVGLKGKLTLAVSSITESSYELSDYGISDQKESDILMGIRDGPPNDYSAPKYGAPTDKSFSGDTLAAFANSYLAGGLTPHKKEEGADDDAGGDSSTSPPDEEL